MFTIDELIKRREDGWFRNKDIKKDEMLRQLIANTMLEDDNLIREEVYNHPEKLIEAFFCNC